MQSIKGIGCAVERYAAVRADCSVFRAIDVRVADQAGIDYVPCLGPGGLCLGAHF